MRFPLAVLALIPLIQFARAQTTANPAGHWQGKVQIPERELGITVDLARNAKGAWIGTITVSGSAAVDVPLSEIVIEGAAVRFAANLPEHANFEGKLSADGSSVSGKAANAAGEAPFQLTRAGVADVKIPPPSSASSKEFEGQWEGALEAGGKVRRVGLKLGPAADGTASATLIALEQGNLEIPVTTVTIQDKQLQLEARSISGTYRGTLGANGEIAGEWSQGSLRVPLNFRHAAAGKTP